MSHGESAFAVEMVLKSHSKFMIQLGHDVVPNSQVKRNRKKSKHKITDMYDHAARKQNAFIS